MSNFSPGAMHRHFQREIVNLTATLLADAVVRDRVLAEQVARLLDALADIVEAHDMDDAGRCRECRCTHGILRGHRACGVHDALSLHTRGYRRHDWRKRAPKPSRPDGAGVMATLLRSRSREGN